VFWHRLFLTTRYLVPIAETFHIVACRPVAGQWPRGMQIYWSRCWVTASETNMLPWKQLYYNRGTVVHITNEAMS
jgi:hypothetical protein